MNNGTLSPRSIDARSNLPILPPASSDERHRWADWLWHTITALEKGSQGPLWTAEQLRYVAAEIEPPWPKDFPVNTETAR